MNPLTAEILSQRLNELAVPPLPEINQLLRVWVRSGGLLRVTDLPEGGQKIELFQPPHSEDWNRKP